MIERARVAVVGGGPAGATCALELARSGFRVTLFEAKESGEKPCGGGIPSRALLDFPDLAGETPTRRIVRRIVLLSPSGRRAVIETSRGIHIFARRDLDSFLRLRAVQAGATLVRARARRIRRLPGERWEIDAVGGCFGPFDHLVGADGVNGVVRRAVSAPPSPRELTLALFAYLPASATTGIVLKFLEEIDGYAWLFPRTDHLSAGICAVHRTVEPARLEEYLCRFIEEQTGQPAPESVKGYLIPAEIAPPASARGRSWALIGDAGGFVDPLTREGIAHAMRSGADFARRLALHAGARTPALPDDLKIAHRFRRGFYRKGFLESMTSLAARSDAIRRVLADLFSGEQSYTGLKGRLLMNALPCGIEAGFSLLTGRGDSCP